MCGDIVDAGVDAPAPPHVITTQPVAGTTGVAVDVKPTAVSDQPIMNVSTATVLMTDGTNPVAIDASSPDGYSVRVAPKLQLASNTQYTVAIDSAVVATSGLPLGPYTWSFSTGIDDVAPHVTSVDPAPNATNVGVSATITVGFDEPVTGVDTTSFTLNDGAVPVAGAVSSLGSTSYELTPTSALAGATTFTVTLTSAIHDGTGNALAQYGFAFTTQ
jgi:hypothetical protein